MHKIAPRMHPGQTGRGFIIRAGGKSERRRLVAETTNLWGGRFAGRTDERFAEFNRSFGFDRKLFEADVRASVAHCEGLRGAGVLSGEEAGRIKEGLRTILERARSDEGYFDAADAEDVHSF